MKVKATTTLTPAQVWTLYDRLAWVNAQAGPAGGEYKTPACRINDDGSFAAAGESCAQNFCSVEFDATNSTLTLKINSRRAALWDTGNCAGMVFSLFREDPRLLPGGEWRQPADQGLLDQFEVQQYESRRTDAPFWQCGLTASRSMDRERSILAGYFRQWHREYWVIYDPETRRIAAQKGAEILPLSNVLDGADYRRLAAEGVKI